MVVVGEKGKAQLQRDQASHIMQTFADVNKVRITFSQVSHVLNHHNLLIVYNGIVARPLGSTGTARCPGICRILQLLQNCDVWVLLMRFTTLHYHVPLDGEEFLNLAENIT